MTHYHVIGIAGLGMSGIAHILLDQGHTVSGCDQQSNALTRELESRGAVIHRGHAADHLNDVEIVVVSSALKSDHPELAAARERGLSVLKRADLWREWSLQKPTLAIAGTHGKTTTTAMCAVILSELGYDPAYLVPAGGPVPGLPRFARWGSGPFVIEADEYDRLFLGLHPAVSIITSVDWDHVDIYPTRAEVEAAFAQFAAQTTETVVLCADDAGARRLRDRAAEHGIEALVVSYGLHAGADWNSDQIAVEDGWTAFAVRPVGDELPMRGRIAVPGRHNVQNALGAVVGVLELLGDVELDRVLLALERFQGAARRFELKGEAGGVTVVDDYAHNPPKVRAAIEAARMRYPERRLVVYFQPHTFSRTAALLDEFAAVFGPANLVRIGEIYPSRERAADFSGIDASYLVQHVAHGDVRAVGGVDEAIPALLAELRPGDVLLTLGAGDGNRVGEAILEELGSALVRRG